MLLYYVHRNARKAGHYSIPQRFTSLLSFLPFRTLVKSIGGRSDAQTVQGAASPYEGTGRLPSIFPRLGISCQVQLWARVTRSPSTSGWDTHPTSGWPVQVGASFGSTRLGHPSTPGTLWEVTQLLSDKTTMTPHRKAGSAVVQLPWDTRKSLKQAHKPRASACLRRGSQDPGSRHPDPQALPPASPRPSLAKGDSDRAVGGGPSWRRRGPGNPHR